MLILILDNLIISCKTYPSNSETKLEMFYLNSTLNFGIPPVLVFQSEVYQEVDRLLTGLTAQQNGTTARWYSNKTSLHQMLNIDISCRCTILILLKDFKVIFKCKSKRVSVKSKQARYCPLSWIYAFDVICNVSLLVLLESLKGPCSHFA